MIDRMIDRKKESSIFLFSFVMSKIIWDSQFPKENCLEAANGLEFK